MKKIDLINFLLDNDSLSGKIDRFKAYVNRYSKPEVLKAFPIKLQVELTNSCNFNCKTCARHWYPLKTGFMDEKLIGKVKRIIPKIDELVLFGYGEPILHPKFFELVDFAKRKNKRVSFFTNGSLINKRNAKKLVEKQVTTITFSLDGANKKTFEKIRKNSNFDKIVEGINLINKYKEEYKKKLPKLEINFVAMDFNIGELPDLIDLASKLKMGRVEVSYLIIWSKNLKKYSALEKDKKEIFDKAKELAKENNIVLDLPHVSGGEIKCNSPWDYSYIRWDGAVQTCCFSDKLKMGDLNKQEFEEIWNDKSYQRIRGLIKKEQYPVDDCKTCLARLKNQKFKDLKEIYLKTEKREKY